MIVQDFLTPLAEVNSNTLTGSDSANLNLERFWAIATLAQIKNQFDTIYILGSWYGNVALLLFMLDQYISFDRIVNVDINGRSLQQGQQRLAQLGLDDKIQNMRRDANDLDYRQLGPDGLVVNLSCHNIDGSEWLAHIPSGTWTVLQARNRDPGAANQFDSLEAFDSAYPLSRTAYQGALDLTDPDGAYEQYMKIGTR
jgi:hypothetical protein